MSFLRVCKTIITVLLLSVAIVSSCSQKDTSYLQSNGNINSNAEKKRNMNGNLSYEPVDKTTAFSELKSYIIDWKFGRKDVPTKLDPVHVEEFIRSKVDRSLHPISFDRSRRVVDFYDLTKVLDHFDKLLDRKESAAKGFNQSIQIVMLLAQVGDANEKKKAADYYDYLVKHQLAHEDFEALTNAIDAFGMELNVNNLLTAMKSEFQKLQAKGKTDREADDQAEGINGLINNELPRAVGERELRTKILAMPKPEERIDQLCRTYLGWGEGEGIELMWWAARQLRRESREERSDIILKSLKSIAKEIEATDLDDEEKFSYRLRSARAVRFFGGTLSTKERFTLGQPAEGQIDVLNRE